VTELAEALHTSLRATADALGTGGPMSWLLILILVLLVIGVAPSWGYSRNWGYGPSGLIGVLLVVFLVLVLTKTIRI